MSRAHLKFLALALAATAFASAGCAVGNFIAGAPSSHSTTPVRALLVRRCTGCHEEPSPQAMSNGAWLAALERMKRRMQLPASEWDSLAVMPTLDHAR